MLKIKDNVDLKELEKYGFEKGYNPTDDKTRTMYIVDKNHRIVFVRDFPWYDMDYWYLCNKKAEETIYDLIKADIVKKIND